MSRPLIRLSALVAMAAGLSLLAVTSGFGATSASYVVQPGDTLWSIAAEDGLTVSQLAAANDMTPGDILLAGRTIVIPSAAGPGDVAGATALATGAAGAPAAGTATVTTTSCTTGEGPYGVLPARLVDDGLTGLAPYFDEWAGAYGVSPALVEAIAWQESGWQQGVVSGTGAVGIGQIEPATAAFVSGDLIGQPLDVYSISDNIRMMTKFVAYLASEEGGNLCATVAAYYEGPANLATYGILPSARPYVADVMGLLPRFE